MNRSNLIGLLKKLDAREFREFGELVSSPFFNKNQSAIKLYEYLKKLYPDFPDNQVEKEHVYSKIFHKADYNDGFMRTVIFNLSNLAEEYLRQVSLKKTGARSALILLEELNNRKLEKILLKNLSAAKKEIEKSKGVSKEYFQNKHLYEALNDNYTNWSRFKNKNMRDFHDENLLNENKYLAAYFLSTALANYRLLLYKKESLSIDFELGFLDETISYILKNEKEFAESPEVIMHVYEIMLLKTKSESYYSRLKEFLSLKEGISRDKKYSLSNILQIYCQYKTYQGEKLYLQESFGLYKTALENGFYRASDDLYFDSLLFPNIARAAMRIGEYGWAAEFIDKYKGELSPEIKEFVVGYLKARLYFEKKEFEKALDTIKDVKSVRHLQYKVIYRNLMLMIFYELSYFDQAEYLLLSYRQYINKHEKSLSRTRYERISEFLKYYSSILKLKSRISPEGADKIIAELNNNTKVIERHWLLEKARELEKIS